jgi:ribonuclease HI
MDWLQGSYLELKGDLETEWNWFISHLLGMGISLQDRPDMIIWMGGELSDKFTVKNAYNTVATNLWDRKEEIWRKNLWKWDFPTKINIFIWLLSTNKVLVWENLQARGWTGPSRCPLCKAGYELALHLFVTCQITGVVWQHVLHNLILSTRWTSDSVSSCLNNWFSCKTSYPSLPTIICWNIWLIRNETVFDEGCPSIHWVIYKKIATVASLGTCHKPHPLCTSHIKLPSNRVIAWFDGAAQHNGKLYGAGGMLHISTHSSFRWTLNCGQGTNTKAELTGAWATLTLARRLNLLDLVVLGDSRIVIDWLNGKVNLQATTLLSWKDRIREALQHFRTLSFPHIFREDNYVIDTLSKEALSMPFGQINYSQWEDGIEGPSSTILL